MASVTTNELRETDARLPAGVQSALLALSVLIDRVEILPKADRDELFDLLQEWRNAETPEDQDDIRRAMEEILAQVPISVKPLPLIPKPVLTRGLQAWAEHVGKKIRALREGQNLTQLQLADRAGLPQSHISRLENAEHSATHLTLEKIARALDVEIGELDPGHE